MSKYTEVDFWFTADGDLDVDSSGDVRDTDDEFGRAVIQEIRDRLRATRGEWKLNSAIGSSVGQFIGEAGTSANITRAKTEISEAIHAGRLLSPGEAEIIPLQLSPSVVIFRIILHTQEGEINTQIGYDSDVQRFIGY
jgi:phage baseplate assembly protein W